MIVKEIQTKEAKVFINKWHYLKQAPGGYNIFFGCFINNELYAIANYGLGQNPKQSEILKKKLNLHDITNKNLYELKRLCRIEPRNDKYPLTQFLSKCHKLLKKKNIKYILSFSDPLFYHHGGIYRAANFRYIGKTKKSYIYINNNGDIKQEKWFRNIAKKFNVTIEDAALGLKYQKIYTLEKDRWFLNI